MDKQQVKQVKASWARVDDDTDRLLDTFYDKLFTAHPEVRAYFPDDLGRQRAAIIRGLDIVIGGLSFIGLIGPIVKSLGLGDDVRNAPKEVIAYAGDAIVATVAELDAPNWTPELNTAWIAAWNTALEAFR